MASTYPATIDTTTTLPNTRATGSVIPASDHNDLATAMIAVQTKLGAGASTATSAKQVLVATGTNASAYVNIDTTYMPPRFVTVPYSANISIDVTTGDIFKITLTGPTTISFTGTAYGGQKIELHIAQDSTGGRIPTLNTANVAFAASLPAPTFSTTAGATDVVGLKYSTTSSKFRFYGAILGF